MTKDHIRIIDKRRYMPTEEPAQQQSLAKLVIVFIVISIVLVLMVRILV